MKHADDGVTTHRLGPDDPSQWQELSLLVLSADGLSIHALPRRGHVVIGRSKQADLQVADTSISRLHARLDLEPTATVTDLGSANGVTVRSARIPPQQPVAVGLGEPLVLGTVTIVLQRGPHPRDRGWISTPSGPSVFVPERRAPHTRAPGPMVAESPSTRQAVQLADQVAPSGLTVLLLGETGVGKEVFAHRIHALSGRSGRLVSLNCAAIAPTLLEAELFGYERGAFTGAGSSKVGLLEAAAGGTVFLDEVGEMPRDLQAKVLRALDQREVLRVGGRQPVAIDARFIAATNRDLRQEVQRGAFRADLYYRINTIAIAIPPLRERSEDIEPLTRLFLGSSGATLSPDARAALRAYQYPGNVRELRHAIDRAVVLAGDAKTIELGHLPPEIAGAASSPDHTVGPPPDDERARILWALDQCAHNQTRAAELLGISRRTLVSRIKEYRIPRPRKGYR